MALPTIIRLFHHQGSQDSTNWIIWADRNAQDVPAKIPNFLPAYNFQKGSYVFHDDRIYRSKKLILAGEFNSEAWEEVVLQTGFVARHEPMRDYEEDSFVLDALGNLLGNKAPVSAGVFNPDQWEAVTSGRHIDTATVYLDVLGEERYETIEEGVFVLLGGVPEAFDPFENMGEVDAYFEKGYTGYRFQFNRDLVCFVDNEGSVPCNPGDRVGLVKSVVGDAVLRQYDADLKPVYLEDATGSGYISFSGDQHLILKTPENKAAVHEFLGVPGTGAFAYLDQDKDITEHRIGPRFPSENKTWNLSEVLFLTEDVVDSELDGIFDEINELAINSYPSDAITSLAYMFLNDTEFNQDLSHWQLFGKTNLSSMFSGATVFNKPIQPWDMQTVTHTTSMFDGASAFNQPLNNWDFANLKVAKAMFRNALVFNQHLFNWEMFGVSDVSQMFQGAIAFNGSLAGWDLGLTGDVSYMFDGASAFNQPVANFRLSRATKLTAMFRNAVEFDQPLTGWRTHDVTDMSYFVAGAIKFNQDLDHFETSNVTSLAGAFDGAAAFNCNVSTWDVSKVTNFNATFRNAVVFAQDISLWQTDSATNMVEMFSGAAAFSYDISAWCVRLIVDEPNGFDADTKTGWQDVDALQPQWAMPCLKYFAHSFYNANLIGTLFQDTEGKVPVTTPGDKVRLMLDLTTKGNHATAALATAPTYRQDINGNGYLEFNNDEFMSFQDGGDNYHTWETIPGIGVLHVTDTDTTIGPRVAGDQKRYVGQFVALADTYTPEMKLVASEYVGEAFALYDQGTVTSLDYYLEGLNTFNEDISGWQMDSVKSIVGLFKDTLAFNQDISSWVMSSLERMDFAFAGAKAFNQDIGGWDTSNVTSMEGVFEGASAFNYDLPWDTAKVTTFARAFKDAKAFNSQVPFDLTSAITIDEMFAGATVFNRPLVGPAPVLESAMATFKGASLFNSAVTDLIGPTVKTIESIFEDSNQFNSDLATWNTSGVESFKRAFARAVVFDSAIDHFDLSSALTIEEMFFGSVAFNQPIDSWTTTTVTNMAGVFDGAIAFNQPIQSWDVRFVETFYRTFSGAAAFNQPLNLWRTESAKTFKMMFQSALVFNQDLANWNTTTVTDFDRMFFNATAFNQDISPWCVKQIPVTGPTMFSFGSPLEQDFLPIWGARCLADLADLWYDAGDITKVFTDEAKTTNPTPGDRVAVLEDIGKLGLDAVQSDVAKRPIYRQDAAGLGYLEFPAGTELLVSGVSGTGVWVNNIPSVGGWGDYITVPSTTFKIDFNAQEKAGATRKMGQLIVYFGAPIATDILVLSKAAGRWAKLYAPGAVSDISCALEDRTEFDWDIDSWNMSRVTRADYLFAGCEIYNRPMDSWDTSALVSAVGMFKDAVDFDQALPWDLMSLVDASYMFHNATVFNGDIVSWNTPALQKMEGMFYNARQFNQPIGNWDVSKVTIFKEAFRSAVRFNQPLLGWNTDSAVDMSRLFQNTEVFNQPLTSWVTASVENFEGMFMSTPVFNQPLNHFDTSSATNMHFMFRDAEDFAQDLDTWNVESVSDFRGMFYGADSFNHNIATWQFNATDILMDEMFREASIFNYDISLWDTVNVTSMMRMFNNAYLFNHNLITWCVKNVTPDEAVDFGESSQLDTTEVPLFGQPCVGELLDGYYDPSIKQLLGINVDGSGVPAPGERVAFIGDISGKGNNGVQADVTKRPVYQEDTNGRGYLVFTDDEHFVVPTITDSSRNWVAIAGRGVPQWEGQPNGPAKLGIKSAGGSEKVWIWAGEAVATDTALTAVELGSIRDAMKLRADAYTTELQSSISYLLANEEYVTGGMTDFRLNSIASLRGLFKGAVRFNEDISGWDTTIVGDLTETFMGAAAFNQDLSGWTTDQVQFLDDAFHGASSFTSDLSGWVTSKVRSFNRAFKDCSNFESDLSGWTIRTDVPVSLMGTFTSAAKFVSDLSSWDTSSVVSMADLFYGALLFNSDLSSWDVRKVTNMTNMFRSAPLFNSDLGDWRVSAVLTMDYMFDGATAFDQDISRWCVQQIASKPIDFDKGAAFAGDGAKQPYWGGFCLTERSEFFHSGSDKDCMWQDTARTIPVTNPGDPVAFVMDLTGNQRHLQQSDNAKRPIYREDDNGVGYLEFGPNHDMIVDYNGRADHIIGVVGRGKMTTANIDFYGGKGIKRYFTPNAIGVHKLTDMAGIAPTLDAASKTSANNTMSQRAKVYAANAQTTMNDFFAGNLNFNNVDVQTWDMREVTSIQSMFSGCASMNLDLSTWNTAKLTNATYAFKDAGAFNKSIDAWNVQALTNTMGMFQGATAYDQPMSSWTTSALATTKWMFKDAVAFNQALSWDMSKVTDVSYMFEGAENFNQNISGWNVATVTTAEGMFKDASRFNNASSSMANMDWSACTNFTHMFQAALNFNAIVDNWTFYSGASAITMAGMFMDARAFNKNVNTWNTTRVTDMNSMFRGAYAFNNGLQALTEASGNFTVANATTLQRMFQDARAFNQNISDWSTGNVTDMSFMFFSNSSVSVFNQPIGSWNVGNVLTMESMFHGTSAFNQNLANWNMSKVTNVTNMFRNATAYDNGGVNELEKWDTSSFTAMRGMFEFATAFNKMLCRWDVSNVTDMTNVFNGADAMTAYLAGWDVQHIPSEPNLFGAVNVANPPQWGLAPDPCRSDCSRGLADAGSIATYLGFEKQWFYQDTAGTTPVTASGQKVMLLEDSSGNGNDITWADAASAPTYREDANGNGYLEFEEGQSIQYAGMSDGALIVFNLVNNGIVSITRDTATGEIFGNDRDDAFLVSAIAIAPSTADETALRTAMGTCGPTYADRNTTFQNLFAGEEHIGSVAGLSTTGVTNFEGTFLNAINFNEDINAWDMSSALTTKGMFSGATAFNQNVSSWVVSSIVTMEDMFRGAGAFNNGGTAGTNSVPLTWTTTALTDITGVFRDASAFNQDISLWNVSGVQSFAFAFAGATSFNQNVSGWTTAAATNMQATFQGATSFNQPLAGWDLTGVVTIQSILEGATSFDQPVNWDVSTVANFGKAFKGASAFNQDLSGWDTASAVDLREMFMSAIVFNSDLSTWDVSDVTFFQGMFCDAISFNGNISTWDTGSAVNMSYMFDGANVFNGDLSNWKTGLVTTMSNMFHNTSDFNKPIGRWDVSKVVDFDHMFSDALAFNQRISCWNTESATNMDDMFNNATSFSQNLIGWCVDKITTKPTDFDTGTGASFLNSTTLQPQWGTCTPGSIGGDNILASFSPTLKETLWQDSGKTVPVANVGDNIAVIEDTSGNGNDLIVTGGCKYMEDSNGLGYIRLEFAPPLPGQPMLPPPTLSIPTVTTSCDIAFVIPSVGDTIVERTNGTDIFGPAFRPMNFGPIVITASGSGSTVRGFDCTEYGPGLTTMLADYFANDTAFNQNLDHWDTSDVEYFYSLFRGATAFNNGGTSGATTSPLMWDMSSAIELDEMFRDATSFNQPVGSWDVSNVTSMESLFEGATSFNQSVNAWTVTVLENAASMFQDATSYNQAMDSWTTPALSDINYMFSGATAFNHPLDNWDVSNVTEMRNVFEGATAFNGTVNGWNTTNCTELVDVFKEASAFNRPLDNWDVSNVTTMEQLFTDAIAFNQPLNTWDVSNVKNFISTFEGALDFNQDLSSWTPVAAEVTEYMFYRASSFNNGGVGTMYWDVSNVFSAGGMFNAASAFNANLSGWKTTRLGNAVEMFKDAVAYNQPMGCWDVSSVTAMEEMFMGATLFDQSLQGWNVENIGSKPSDFDTDSGIENDANKLPIWGTSGTGGLTASSPLSFTRIADIEGLWQDFAKTTAATADGDPVAVAEDFSGNSNEVWFQNTTLRIDGNGNGYLEMTNGGNLRADSVRVAADLSFNVPGVGHTFVPMLASGSGVTYWNQPATMMITDIVITESGFGNTVTGHNCKTWIPGTTTSLDYLFAGQENFNGDLSHWDTTGVTSAQYMFFNAKAFNQPLNHFDMSAVENVTGMFNGAEVFNQDLNSWDVSKVTSASSMFREASAFNGDISNWSMPLVNFVDNMFYAATAFNSDVSNLNPVKATTFSQMFTGAIAFNNGSTAGDSDNPLTWTIPEATDMNRMFRAARSFNQDISTFETGKVTDMEFMFNGAIVFNRDIGNWDVSKVTLFESMFEEAIAFTNNGQPMNWDISSAVEMEEMFKDAESFNAPMPNWAFPAGANLKEMLENAKVFNQDVNTWTFAAGVTADDFMEDCTLFNNGSAPGASDNPLTWDTSLLEDMSGLLRGCASFNQPVPNLSFAGVEAVSSLFRGCALFNQPLDHLDTSMITNFAYMFTDAEVFNQDISMWDTSKADSMGSMFSGALAFNQPLANWDVSNVVDMYEMFSGAEAFNQPLGCWDVSSVDEYGMEYMFQGATLFDQNLSGWCVSNIAVLEEGFDEGAAFEGNASKHPQWGSCPTNGLTADGAVATAAFDDKTLLWQDAAKTVPVTSDGDTVLAIDSRHITSNTVSATITVNGTATYREDAVTGTGYLELDAGAELVFPGVTSTNIKYIYEIPTLGQVEVGSAGDITENIFWGKSQSVKIARIVATLSTGGLSPVGLGCGKYEDVGTITLAEHFDDWLINNTNVSNWTTGSVTSMSGLFRNDTLVVPDISGWDVSKVTDFSFMFENVSAMNADISGWNTEEGTNFEGMFKGATTFNVDIGSWNTSKATNLTSMFEDAAAFNYDISGWTMTGSVLTTNKMFKGAAAFNRDMTNFNVTNVTDMSEMFANTSAFNGALTGWDPQAVTTTEGMFENTSVFNQPIAWTNTTALTNTSRMFKSALAYNNTVNINTALVTNASEMFAGTWAFDTALGALVTFPAAKDLSNMFNGAAVFNKPVAGLLPNVGEDFTGMFRNAEAFNQPLTGWTMTEALKAGHMFSGAAAFNQPVNFWDMGKVTDISFIFANAAAFDQVIDTWDLASVTSMPGVFNGAAAYNQSLANMTIPTAVTDLSDFFNGATSFNQEVNHWTVTQVLTMQRMFSNAAAFNKSVANWDPSVCENMEEMFRGATVFNQSMPCWNVSAVTEMTAMFRDAVAFDQDIGSWCVGNNIANKPLNFAANSPIDNTAKEPKWGVACTAGGGLGADNMLALFDPRDMSTLFQDAARTIPVMAAGDVVRGITDLSGNDNHAEFTGNNARYGEDSNGTGCLFIGLSNPLRVPTITDAADTAFILPNIGDTFIPHLANAGGLQFYNRAFGNGQEFGPIVVTASGSGNTISGKQCIAYDGTKATSTSYLFYNEEQFNGDLSDWDMSGVTEIKNMFQRARNWNNGKAPGEASVLDWDVSGVTNMVSVFHDANAMNVDIGNWDVSNVTTFSNMLRGTTVFNNGDNANMNWTIKDGANLEFLFYDAAAFNRDISGWNIAGNARLASMLEGAIKFNNGEAAGLSGVPLTSWDLSQVTTIAKLFYEAESFNQDVSNWDVGNVVDMNGVFGYCKVFNQDVSGWDTKNATNMSSAFRTCWAFNQDLSGWDTSKNTNFSFMFLQAKVFNNGSTVGNDKPLSFDTSAGTNFLSMFNNANAFNQDISSFDLSNATATAFMFSHCHVFNQNINGIGQIGGDNINTMFGYCREFDNVGVPMELNLPTATNVKRMFAECYKLNQPIKMTAPVLDSYEDMLYRCSIYDADVSELLVPSATKLTGLFWIAMAFTGKGLDNWDVSNITDFTRIFRNTSINKALNCWDFSSATNMSNMFGGANSMDADISGWCVPNITTEPTAFATGAPIATQPAKLPDWANMAGCTKAPTTTIDTTGMLAAFDMQDTSRMWQDEAKTVPVTAAGQTVRVIEDMSGNGNDAVLGNGAKYQEDANGVGALEMATAVSFKVAGVTTACEVIVEYPTIGKAHFARLANAGGQELWNKFINNLYKPKWGAVVIRPDGSGDDSIPAGACAARADYTDMTFSTSAEYALSGEDYILSDMTDWTTAHLKSIAGIFRDTANFNQDISTWDLSAVENADRVFTDAKAFNQDLEGWVGFKPTRAAGIFERATAFNGAIDGWDMSRCTNFYNMFSGATSFNKPVGSWSTVEGGYMQGVFRGATMFNQPLTNWTFPKAFDVSFFFANATAFNQDVNNLDFSTVGTVRSMFNGATAFNNGSVAGASDNPLTINFANSADQTQVFQSATAFNQPLPNITFGKAGTDITSMFLGASVFNQSLSHWDTTNVDDMASVFKEATLFNNGSAPGVSDNPLTWNTTAVTSTKGMFCHADSFNQEVPFDVGNVTDGSEMFREAALFNQNVASLQFTQATTLARIFENAVAFNNGSADGVTGAMLNWASTNALVNAESMFEGASIFDQDVSLQTGSITNAKAMFKNAPKFDRDMMWFSFGEVLDMSEMFRGATAFTGSGIDFWQTGKATDMSFMFADAAAFNAVPVTWSFTEVTNMTGMFSGATSMNQDISGWCVPKITVAPTSFDLNAGFAGNAALQPQWGVPC
ncbi:hypothetical protein [Vibrio phage vB_pir03]|nr:hypothetical protein [Vibrio phage vB_pir03]